MTVKTKHYKGTNQQFYTVSKKIAASLNQRLADFATFSQVYDQTYVDDLIQQIKDAEEMPDEQTRDEKTETQRVLLEEATKKALNDFQDLKRYAEKTFTNPDILKGKLEAAGIKYYEKAANNDWEAGASLFSNAVKFIGDNLAALSTKMPSAFKGKMQGSKEKVETLYAELIALNQQKTKAGKDKFDANNKLYDEKISEICKDGQAIYRNSETIKAEFVYETVLELSGGTHQTGFKGYILNEATSLPIEGAKLTSTDGKYVTITNEEGHFDFQQITGGAHTFKIEKDGFTTQVIEVTLETGVTKTVTYKLIEATPVAAN